MDLEHLRSYLAVIRHGGFTKAAQALGVSQSTVSTHVKSLEAESGVRLLDRTRKPLGTTKAGETVLRYAERAIAARDGLVAELGAQSEGHAGFLDIVASSVPAEWMLPAAIAELRESHPGVSVRVATHDSARAAASVANGDHDLAFLGSQPQDRRLDLFEVASDEILLVGAAAFPLKLGADGRQLEGVPLVGRTTGSGTYVAIESLLARHGPATERPYVVEVSSTQAVKACVLEGLGLGFLSRRAVAKELEAGTLVSIELEGLPFRRPLYVAYRRGASLGPAAMAIIGAMRRV